MSRSGHIYLGIDFSGNKRKWGPNVKESNIWLAKIESVGEVMNLISLQRVQQLRGPNRPFARLVALLSDAHYTAAAIDAPFSIPDLFFGQQFIDHSRLISMVHGLQLRDGHDFPQGPAFVVSVGAGAPFQNSKPLRVTESYWRSRGVNIRSTVWPGVRHGAPFTSACIKLLAQANRPIWPWANRHHGSFVVEAFPAAQLKRWGLPFQGYNGPANLAQTKRDAIVSDLTNNQGLKVGGVDFRTTIRQNAGALDSVLCSYAARAVHLDLLGTALPPRYVWYREGWIAIHK